MVRVKTYTNLSWKRLFFVLSYPEYSIMLIKKVKYKQKNNRRTYCSMKNVQEYKEVLFNEMRIYPIEIIAKKELNEESMIKAMTVRENLSTGLGIGLTPADVIKLAKSNDIDNLYDDIKEAIGQVKAKPMYPDFPNTVMEIDESVFRFHQLLHYFSAYGIEELTGNEVLKGWMPAESGTIPDTEKTEKDDKLLPDKLIELIDIRNMFVIPVKKVLSKRNRASLNEKDIVKFAVENMSDSELKSLVKSDIPFKENLYPLFFSILNLLDPEKKNQNMVRELLHYLCQHTGDVFDCIRYVSVRYHRLKVSQQRLLVRLLESYPITDFKANMIISLKKSENTKFVLNYLSFNKYSRSKDHFDAVNDLRDGKLHSWESKMKFLLEKNDKENALDFIGKRPGMLLRMIAWLTRLGYDKKMIAEKLLENVNSLSIQTIVSILNYFGNYGNIDQSKEAEKTKEFDSVYYVCTRVLEERLKSVTFPFKDKKVYINEGIYSFADSQIEFNSASSEGGYLRSGLAVKIPHDVNVLRFFVYWNDYEKRVDIDLHSYAYTNLGERFMVGWNSSFRNNGIVHSGDIVNNNAAEYIDIDLNRKSNVEYNKYAVMNINIYTGKPNFGAIDECFAGLMAVKQTKETVNLYDPKNCIITHNLKSNEHNINYGFIDIPKRLLHIVVKGKDAPVYEHDVSAFSRKIEERRFSLKTYVEILLKAQKCTIVEKEDEADNILILDKPNSEKEISLIDNNYFADN